MKNYRPVLWLIILFHCVSAQSYLGIGMGFSSVQIKSGGLENFKNTYNLANASNIVHTLQGFGSGEGLQLELGYCRLGKLSISALLGWQEFTSTDFAKFGNNAKRTLELRMEQFYLELGMGTKLKKMLFQGLFLFNIYRQYELDSKYTGTYDDDTSPIAHLSGTYKLNIPVSADMGISIGYVHEPVLLTGKIFYPVYVGDKNRRFQDNSPIKKEHGVTHFPDDYIRYLNQESYNGVSGDMNRLKFVIAILVLLPLSY